MKRNLNNKSDNWRFARLGALTLGFLKAASMSRDVLKGSEVISDVDALSAPPPDGGEWPFVSIIVPARNEERNLPGLLPTLLAQHYPNYEVIVVDDQSEDTTPQVLADWAARDPKLKVVKGGTLPREEGWLGKPNALRQGVENAKGDWLLFTDADTRHEPLALSSCMSFALSRSVDLLSILPCFELLTPVERLIMPVSFMGIMYLYPASKVNDPNSNVALSNGQYMLLRREAYEAVGGIERVKSEIVEDLEFAKVIKSAGRKLFLADARHLVSVRMYESFSEIWEGWSKNTIIALRKNPRTIPISILGITVVTGGPLLMAKWAVGAWRQASRSGQGADKAAASWVSALVVLQLAAYLRTRREVDKALGLPAGWAFTQPLGGLIVGLIMLSSLTRLVTGRGVVWKGRTYHAGEAK